MKILTFLKDSPIPTFLLLTGIIFIALPFVTQIGGKIKITSWRQILFIGIGIFLFFFGISLYSIPSPGNRFIETSPPRILGVNVRTSHEAAGLVYTQEVNFYDDDGNTNRVEWELVDLSDPSQGQYIPIQPGLIDTPPEIQKIRATATKTWPCEGHIYVATLEVFLVDSDYNRSEPIRFTIDCK